MNSQSGYKTKQREAILKYLVDNSDSHVTVCQIADYLSSNGNHVGVTTIYRHLEKLLEQGLVRKYTVDGSTGACFQYVQENSRCREHFHLKCEKCGCLIHLECSHLDELYEHIYDDHAFRINPFRTVFYGICKECSAKENTK
ncbi:MAG: Fur family transcriptional regulator [Clostridia bacterium]|nr:Fur family transcriptional regulator [Clostridia bacterium]